MPGLAMDGPSAMASRATVADMHYDPASASQQANGGIYRNGIGKKSHSPVDGLHDSHIGCLHELPPELSHITLGFFPFNNLISRVVQQSWNDLNELLNEMGSSQAYQTGISSQLSATKNGMSEKFRGDQATENSLKKLRILEFTHSRRAEFIKLLVLSQWSRQANEVSRLIDIQAFIRMRSGFYEAALFHIGNMKQNLIVAQLANPDLKTASHVLSAGKIDALHGLEFLSPRPLAPSQVLRLLRGINKLIDMRLALHDHVPDSLQNYFVHDGRVTFIVPNEFEIDLSVASAAPSAQFFLVDMKFLFFPSSLPKGRLRSIVDHQVNSTLMNAGLAIDLARTYWSEHLRVELFHRTLVLQYWSKKPGGKSWIEIGVHSGLKGSPQSTGTTTSFLQLRWFRDNEEVSATDIDFNLTFLSAKSILFSAISLHITHILRTAFEALRQNRLYCLGGLYIGMSASSKEPGDCYLELQMTQTSHLDIMVEAVSGDTVLRVAPSPITRYDTEIIVDRGSVEDIVERVSRLRCVSALEEVERYAKAVGWMPLNLRHVNLESLKRIFPPSALRSMLLFRAKCWEPSWLAVFTSAMDGDNWWIVQLQTQNPPALQSHWRLLEAQRAKLITGWFTGWLGRLHNASFSSLLSALSGMIMVQCNVDFLNEIGAIHFFPPPKDLLLQPCLRVSAISPAITMVYGRLMTDIDMFGALYAKYVQDIAFQPKGRGFAILFRTPVGTPIIAPLLERLQQMNNIAFVVESMKSQGFQPHSLSPLRIKFSYPTQGELRGSIKFIYHDQGSHFESKLLFPATTTKPILHPRIGIDFNYQNPHRRITESLSTILNSHKDGMSLVLELINITLPLTQRRLYQIRYPFLRYRFNVSASQRKSYVVWVIQNSTPGPERSKHPSLELRLKDQIYNSQGDGWRGINQGAMAYSANVSRLVFDLHQLMKSYISQMAKSNQRGEPTDSSPSAGCEFGRYLPKNENKKGHIQTTTAPTLEHAYGNSNMVVQSVRQGEAAARDVDVIAID
ncbi:mediator of RNA polymerase 2 transcription subunit 14 [Coccidioides immitis RMSCC 3703]|uniref:Mediator of RNA polymerase II transcription subunit 14 n=1 Tax=Coccidioides immitis RMSCC 3703 TaxID=454286 RepID=A0A0J8RE05_COCIT|nr:mediator of RNA polymerase 2 transcription subunit 14 [Coccidioides immitis RMSCC 3703]